MKCWLIYLPWPDQDQDTVEFEIIIIELFLLTYSLCLGVIQKLRWQEEVGELVGGPKIMNSCQQ